LMSRVFLTGSVDLRYLLSIPTRRSSDLESAHPRRPRCKYFGEMIQMDASSFEWIPGHIWHLHLAVDDSTGTVVGAYFDTQETLKDRKSTRLNSSHVSISYAVFCLTTKKP